jgi:midasin (ATPase involved in ribosome maturation)
MACEAVALIANALTKLEVGEVAIAKFGEFPQLLHAFDAVRVTSLGSFL